ncbi:hypothetical protein ACI2KR_21320 [Pseudomonas luteola]
MFVFVLALVFAAVLSVMAGQVAILQESFYESQAHLDAYYVGVSSEALRMRMIRTSNLRTASLDDLVQSGDEGFKVKAVDDARVHIASQGKVNDGSYIFDRALVFAVDPKFGSLSTWSPSDASNNRCDPDHDITTAATWCGPVSGVVYDLIETREIFLQTLTDEVLRMDITLQKIARGYNVVEKATFPHGNLLVGQGASVCYAGDGTAEMCFSTTCNYPVVMLQQTPMDCSDQFSDWGNATVLTYVSPKHIALVSSSPRASVKHANGTGLSIARELRVP